MTKFLLSVGLSLLATVAQAQPRPGAFTTIVSTDTTATSICAGCAAGGTSPAPNSGIAVATVTLVSGTPSVTTNKLYQVGGSLFFNGVGLATGSSVSGTTGKLAKFTSASSLGDSIVTESAGPAALAIAGNTTMSGILTVNGFGSHIFSAGGTVANSLQVRNTTAGTGNYADLSVGNDGSAAVTIVRAFSSTYTSDALNLASGSLLYGAGVGGLSVAAGNGSGAVRFYAGGNAEKMRLFPSGGFSVGNTVDPGATNFRLTGSAVIGNGATITNSLTVTSGGAAITGNTTLAGTLGLTGNATVSGTFSAGTTTLGALTVTGTSTLSSLGVTGAATVGGTLGVTGATTLGGTLAVAGEITSGGNKVSPHVVVTAAPYTAVAGDFILVTGAGTITLPAPTLQAVVDVKNLTAGTVTVVPAGAAGIDAAGSYVLSLQYQSVTVVGDGTNWWVR